MFGEGVSHILVVWSAPLFGLVISYEYGREVESIHVIICFGCLVYHFLLGACSTSDKVMQLGRFFFLSTLALQLLLDLTFLGFLISLLPGSPLGCSTRLCRLHCLQLGRSRLHCTGVVIERLELFN